ncbi:NAD(P)-binding protein, partial [Thozetella sp. PMI_491]
MPSFMIYGATGYTGRIAAGHAKSSGLDVILAGRTESKIRELAASLNVPFRVFDVNDPQHIQSHIEGVCVLLNCAGPFVLTAEPFMDACIRCGTHYLDVSAELISYQLAERRDAEARAAGVMLLPGCGGSVAMLGCLAGYALRGVKSPSSIDIALRVAGTMSRGSALSAATSLTPECLELRDGKLVKQDAANNRDFDFDNGEGSVTCFPVTLPDLVTIWRSAAVPNIRTFVYATEGAFPSGDLALLPDGPSVEERKANPYHGSVSVTSSDGLVKSAVLHTVNGYDFTPMASVEAARRVL